MTTVAQSSSASNLGTEDAMEMSTDPTWRVHENDEIEIDSNFGESHGNMADDEMAPVYGDDSSLIPFDVGHDSRHHYEPSDAAMDDRGSESYQPTAGLDENKDIELVEADDGRHVGHSYIEEDLLDETDDAISDSEQPSFMADDHPEHLEGRPSSRNSIDPPTNNDLNLPAYDQTYRSEANHAPDTGSKTQLSSNSSHPEARTMNEIAEITTLNNTLTPRQPSSPKDSSNREDYQSLVGEAAIGPSVTAEPRLATSATANETQLDPANNKILQTGDFHESNGQSSVLHPVFVVYQDQESPLFPLIHQGPEISDTHLLDDVNLAWGGIRNLLSACREVLPDSIDEYEELEIAIEDLDLRIRESDIDFPNISFARIVELFVKLNQNEGNFDPPPLYIYLYTVTNHSRWWTHLTALEAEGTGISALTQNEAAQEDSGSKEKIGTSATEAYNAGQDQPFATLEPKDDRTGQMTNQEKINTPPTYGRSDHKPESGQVAENLFSVASQDGMESNGMSKDTNYTDAQAGFDLDHENHIAPSSEVAKDTDAGSLIEKPPSPISGAFRGEASKGTSGNDLQFPAELIVEEPPDKEALEESTDQNSSRDFENDDHTTVNGAGQADADALEQAELLAVESIEMKANEQEDDGLNLHQKALQADPVDGDHFEGEEQLQEDPQHVEAKDESLSDSVGSPRDVDQVPGGEDDDVFNDVDDADIEQPHVIESGNQKLEDILTDEEIDELNNADQISGEVVSDQVDPQPVGEGSENLLDDEDWDLGTEIEAAPALPQSPGSLKRTRSWNEDEIDDSEREDKTKRSRAS